MQPSFMFQGVENIMSMTHFVQEPTTIHENKMILYGLFFLIAAYKLIFSELKTAMFLPLSI